MIFIGEVRGLAMLLPALLLIPLGALATESATDGLQSEQCEAEGCSARPASNLLQISSKTLAPDDSFGPGSCVGLRRSSEGSCVLQTKCKGINITDTEFAFVCFNPGESMPHALHSFGRGGFMLEEMFDTKVRCKTCISVDTAFQTGDSVMRNALAALPLSRLPSLNGALQGTGVYSIAELAQFKPKEAAVFGPDFCMSTFLAPAGTCLIRTRCGGVDLSKFNIGVTCLDQSGGYTRYLFGKGSFKPEETFDTLVTCEKCLGVGPESSQFAMHGLMPRKLVEDVNTLKTDLQTLNEKVRVLQESGAEHYKNHDKHYKNHDKDHHHHKEDVPRQPSESAERRPSVMPKKPRGANDSPQRRGDMPKKPSEMPEKPPEIPNNGPQPMPPAPRQLHIHSEVSEDAPMPTVIMSRRRPDNSQIPGADWDVSEELQEPLSGHAVGFNIASSAGQVGKEAGAETAAMAVGTMQVVTHRRGNAIADLLRRVHK